MHFFVFISIRPKDKIHDAFSLSQWFAAVEFFINTDILIDHFSLTVFRTGFFHNPFLSKTGFSDL